MVYEAQTYGSPRASTIIRTCTGIYMRLCGWQPAETSRCRKFG